MDRKQVPIRTPSRRQFIKTTAVTGATVTGLASASGSVAAQQPLEVTITDVDIEANLITINIGDVSLIEVDTDDITVTITDVLNDLTITVTDLDVVDVETLQVIVQNINVSVLNVVVQIVDDNAVLVGTDQIDLR